MDCSALELCSRLIFVACFVVVDVLSLFPDLHVPTTQLLLIERYDRVELKFESITTQSNLERKDRVAFDRDCVLL